MKEDKENVEKYFVAIEDGIAYARRHGLYRDHPDLTNAEYALRQLRAIMFPLPKDGGAGVLEEEKK